MENTLPNLKSLKRLAEHSDVYQQSERLAIIDMGSNSFRLIVIEYVPQLSFKMIDEVREAVRLNQGMGKDDMLQPKAMARAVQAAQIYAAFCDASGISEVVVVGTSAIRTAANQQTFLTQVLEASGLRVRVLSGYEEAYYGYLAAVNSTTLRNGTVMDLGGGSLQITKVVEREMRESVSLHLGAVAVTERYLPYDPPTFREIERLREHLRESFTALHWFQSAPNTQLVGEGGSLRLIARLAQKLSGYPLENLHGYAVSRDQVRTVYEQLAGMDVQSRKRLPGMKADRADISLAAALVVLTALETSGYEEMLVCSEGMREGLFYERFFDDGGEHGGVPIFADVRQAAVHNLAHLYRFQEQHARHIVYLTLRMFDQLRQQAPHKTDLLADAERELLWAASMLHDIGVAIDYHDHHQHSAYLIINAGLAGYTHREISLIALITRYHRKGKPSLDEFTALMEKGDIKRLAQMSALLRLAEQFDRARDGAVQDIVIQTRGDSVTFRLHSAENVQVAIWSAEHHREAFEQAFGLKLELAQA